MTPEKWENIKKIFSDVLEIPVDQRPGYLERVCTDDYELKSEVEKLIDSYDENDQFLENSAVAEVADAINDDSGKEVDLKEKEIPRFHSGDLLKKRYEVLRLLGKGGMGAVYLAKDTKIDRMVSIKVLHSEIASNKERLRRFAQEARAVSSLNHPNIMTIYEFDQTSDGIHFIVGEFVDGKTLNNYKTGEKLHLIEVLEIATQVASALSAAHESGTVHRDIKPENIMVRLDGYIKVLDFGLAKFIRTKSSSVMGSEDPTRELNTTNPGSIMGTASYMSPEQARGSAVDARTDIWSLGVVIYELLTGARPFSGESPADILVNLLRDEPPPLRSFDNSLPSELEWIVSKTLSKKLDGRYQSANELRADLEKIKKRIEFDEESNRSLSSGMRAAAEPGRASDRGGKGGGVRTLGGLAKKTRGGTDDALSVPATWTSPSLIMEQVRLHKMGSAIAAVVLIAIVSATVYFAFFTTRSEARLDSIAVLPFENPGGNQEITYLSDGISDSLIDRLSQLPQLKVISRNSSFKFRGENLELPDIASKLGVRVIVTGRVVQIGDQLSIRVDVTDTIENRQLWGEQFNRPVGDLVTIQNDIAQAVFAVLELKMTDAQTERMTGNGTTNSEAFRYYLSGLVELHGPQNILGRSLAYFQKAVELDPNFADARVEIAWIYWSRANASGDPKKLMPMVKDETARALADDPANPKAHLMLATLKEYEFDWPGAEKEYLRAVALNPNSDFVRNNYAVFLAVMGRQKDSMDQLDQLKMRDPINEREWLKTRGTILAWGRQFDEALKSFQESEAEDQTVKVENFSLGYVYAGKGLYNEAATRFKASVEVVGGDDAYSIGLVFLAASYANMPDKRDDARTILKKIESMPGYVSPATLAIVYAALDDNDKAIESLERAYLERDVQLRFIGVGFEYDSLRKDPRFVDLLKRTGLQQ